MKINLKIIFALLAISIFALGVITSCSDDDDDNSSSDGDTDGDTDGGADSGADGGQGGQFGDSCKTVNDCQIPNQENVCHEFGQLGKLCTFTCKIDKDCPDGSEGQKCNKKNVCKP